MATKYIRHFTFKKCCPLSLIARLVYSYLAYRARLRTGTRAEQIAAVLRISQGNTLRRVLHELTERQLVKQNAAGWVAEPPNELTSEWFASRKSKKRVFEWWEWSDRFAYFHVYLPSATCPLDCKQLVIYSLICDFRHKTLSYGLLATLAGIPEFDRHGKPTNHCSIKAAVKKLQRLGLLGAVTFRRGKLFRISVPEPAAEQLSWFRDRREVEAQVDDPGHGEAPAPEQAREPASPVPQTEPEAPTAPITFHGELVPVARYLLDAGLGRDWLRQVADLMHGTPLPFRGPCLHSPTSR